MTLQMSNSADTIAAVPHHGLRAWMLRQVMSPLQCGTLTIVTPDGTRATRRTDAPGPDATLVLHRWRTLRRLLFDGDVGFAEAYIDGDWSSPDVSAVIEIAARNHASLSKRINGTRLAQWVNRLHHRRHTNTRRGSRRNIVHHYDLGNEFYAHWLDPGMTYSSALYLREDMTLAEAQTAKQDRALALLFPPNGSPHGGPPRDAEVLEIGCGWGGIAERLVACGCNVVGLTLSPSQLAHARARLGTTGHAARADLRLQDYRDTSGTFDGIISIEMLEAVGERYWPAYFDTLRARLKPAGRAVLQVITIAEERFESYRSAPDFIQRYIFPGGMLPTDGIMRREIARAGLRLLSLETFGASYARTLAEWRQRFGQAWPEIAAMGFPDRFRGMWEYYLHYCEGGFRAGAIDVGLWLIAHAEQSALGDAA
jgi:cyclopropane-fatty-acyl-phospholipid synthase